MNSSSSSRVNLTLKHKHSISRSEITHVALCPTSTSPLSGLAISPTTQHPSQSWIDTFHLTNASSSSSSPVSLVSHVKTSGSQASFAPDGSQRAATLRDWTVQLGSGVEYHHASSILVRDAKTGKSLCEIKGVLRGGPLAWSLDGRWVAAAEDDHRGNGERVGVWDARTGRRVGRVMSHIAPVTHAAFTADGNIATQSTDGTLRITNPLSSRTISRLEIDSSSNPRALAVYGQSVAAVWGTTVHIWIPATGDMTSYSLNSVRAVEGWPLCISPDGRWMACRTEAGFDVMELASGDVVCEKASEALVTAGAFSVNGETLLVGRIDGMLEVWAIKEGKA